MYQVRSRIAKCGGTILMNLVTLNGLLWLSQKVIKFCNLDIRVNGLQLHKKLNYLMFRIDFLVFGALLNVFLDGVCLKYAAVKKVGFYYFILSKPKKTLKITFEPAFPIS